MTRASDEADKSVPRKSCRAWEREGSSVDPNNVSGDLGTATPYPA